MGHANAFVRERAKQQRDKKMANAIPLPCFVQPKTLPFPRAEISALTNTPVERILKIYHWRFGGWVTRDGMLPITFSFRRLSTWLPRLREAIDTCKGWRRLCALAKSLEAEFVKYSDIYSEAVREELRDRLSCRRAQLEHCKPRAVEAEDFATALEAVIHNTSIAFLKAVEPLVRQHDALWARFPHLLERLREAWRQRVAYLQGLNAA